MQVYGSNQTLKNNQSYTVTARIKGVHETWNFTSRFNPAYSTSILVRNITGGLLDDTTDEQIDFAIWQTSQMIDETFPTDKDKVQYAYVIKQYTMYKTAYDVAFAYLADYGAHAGSQQKDLGDLKVSKDVKTPKIDDLLKNLHAQMMKWELRLYGAKAKPASAIKAGQNYMMFPPDKIQNSSSSSPRQPMKTRVNRF